MGNDKTNSKYKYVILATCFLISFIIDGTLYAFGAIKNSIKEYYNVTETQISGVGSIANGAYLICGPLAAMFEHRFGCRATTIVGSLVASISMCASTFSPNIIWMMIIYGVIGGTGFGFAYLPVITTVSRYFKNKSALAMSVNVAGSGLGTIVFAPLSAKLFKLYGWKVGLYILAALVLNCVIGGALLRPPPDEHHTDSRDENDDVAMNNNEPVKENSLHSIRISSNENDPSATSLLNAHTDAETLPSANNEDNIENRPSSDYPGIAMLVLDKSGAVADSPGQKDAPRKNDKEADRIERKTFKNTYQSLLRSSGFDLLRTNRQFVFVCLANVLSMIGYYVPYVFLSSMGESMGMTMYKSAYLISTIGILNTASRPLTGLIVEWTPVSALSLNNFGLFMASIVTFPIAFYGSTGLFVYAGLFGFFIAPHISMTPVFLKEIFGNSNIGKTYGMVMFFRGISSAISPMICGELTERTKSYVSGFVLGASTLMASCLLHCVVSVTEMRRKNRRALDNPAVAIRN